MKPKRYRIKYIALNNIMVMEIKAASTLDALYKFNMDVPNQDIISIEEVQDEIEP